MWKYNKFVVHGIIIDRDSCGAKLTGLFVANWHGLINDTCGVFLDIRDTTGHFHATVCDHTQDLSYRVVLDHRLLLVDICVC
jgi:hypothetical protein